MSAEPTFTAPRGMRDFYPADMAVRQAIFTAWTDAAQAAGFDAYDACVVESLDLLKRKAARRSSSVRVTGASAFPEFVGRTTNYTGCPGLD